MLPAAGPLWRGALLGGLELLLLPCAGPACGVEASSRYGACCLSPGCPSGGSVPRLELRPPAPASPRPPPAFSARFNLGWFVKYPIVSENTWFGSVMLAEVKLSSFQSNSVKNCPFLSHSGY